MAPVRCMRGAAGLLAAAATALACVQVAAAAFSARAENGGNVVSAAPDFRPPQVTAVAVGKSAGGATGFVKAGGGYFVYANVAADTGNPASGIAGVSANLVNLTAGATAVPLVAGTYSAGGAGFNYRSAEGIAGGALGEGARALSVTATDNALNAGSAPGSVVVDNTPASGTDVQATNGGTNNGLAEQGDTLTLTFGEPIEPGTVLAGWSGAATNVVVRINDNGLLGLPLGNDSAQVYNAANQALLPLGTVDLGRSDYLSGLLGGNVRFGATGTPSTMTMGGNAVTIVLGTYNSTIVVDPGRTTAAGSGTMTWTPAATPTDRAGNATSTAAVAEGGAADRDF